MQSSLAARKCAQRYMDRENIPSISLQAEPSLYFLSVMCRPTGMPGSIDLSCPGNRIPRRDERGFRRPYFDMPLMIRLAESPSQGMMARDCFEKATNKESCRASRIGHNSFHFDVKYREASGTSYTKICFYSEYECHYSYLRGQIWRASVGTHSRDDSTDLRQP